MRWPPDLAASRLLRSTPDPFLVLSRPRLFTYRKCSSIPAPQRERDQERNRAAGSPGAMVERTGIKIGKARLPEGSIVATHYLVQD